MSAQHTPGPFPEALKFARRAMAHRALAKRIRSSSSSQIDGWTLGQCERAARRCEGIVRSIADAAIAKATGEGEQQ